MYVSNPMILHWSYGSFSPFQLYGTVQISFRLKIFLSYHRFLFWQKFEIAFEIVFEIVKLLNVTSDAYPCNHMRVVHFLWIFLFMYHISLQWNQHWNYCLIEPKKCEHRVEWEIEDFEWRLYLIVKCSSFEKHSNKSYTLLLL